MKILPPVSISARGLLAGRWDVLAAILVFGAIVLIADESRSLVAPLTTLKSNPLTLSPWALPEYALRTTLRMLVALVVFAGFHVHLCHLGGKERARRRAARSAARHPAVGADSGLHLDHLRVFPVAVAGPRVRRGARGVFAIFTSQAWNMAFSFYQSLRTVPPELEEAGRVFGLSRLGAFLADRGALRHALARLEHDDVDVGQLVLRRLVGGDQRRPTHDHASGHRLLHRARHRRSENLGAILWAIAAMLIVILIYDQLLFRPLVTWSDRFRFEQEQNEEPPQSWVLTMFRRSRLIDAIAVTISSRCCAGPIRSRRRRRSRLPLPRNAVLDARRRRFLVRGSGGASRLRRMARDPLSSLQAYRWADVLEASLLGLATLVRVLVLIALASAIWTPIGIYVGLRPKLARIVQPVAQFLAAFPANLLFPLAVSAIVTFHLNPDIWLSPLMVLGTQWYILFNVDRRRLRHALGIARRRRQFAGPWLAVVAKGRACPAYFPSMSPARSPPPAAPGTRRSSRNW